MECLICYKVSSNHFSPNSHLSTTISKLLEVSTISCDNSDNSKSLRLCFECHEVLDRVQSMLGQLDELQLKLSQIRAQITEDLIKSEELSQLQGNQLEERSKIVQELCSTIGKECTAGVPVQDKVNVLKNAAGFYDENEIVGNFYDSPLFAFATSTYDGNDLTESNAPLKQEGPSLTSIPIPTKEVKIILEPFQFKCPSGGAVSFNINEEPIASFILRDQENITKARKCRKFQSSTLKLTSTPTQKIKKRKRKCIGRSWRPPRKPKKTQADYKINFQDRVKFCSICNIHFQRPFKYREHLSKHTGELPFSCDRCVKRFRTNTLLKYHLRIHGIGEGVVQCVLCSLYLTSKKKADIHYNITHGGLRPFKCLEAGCARIFASEKSLVNHGLTQHLGQKLPCTYPQCQKTYNSSTGLKTHIERAHLIKEFKYQCKEPGCNNGYHIPSGLKRHTEKVHLMIKNFKCDKCPKSFYWKSKFDRHYRINHIPKDQLTNSCSFCSKSFDRKYDLKKHLKLHLGTGDQICQYCGEQYSSGLHIDRKHLGNDGYLIADTTKRRKVGRRFRVQKLPNLKSENLADFL